MHVPERADVLPDYINPIPMPDTRREAEMLVLLLDAGLYPRIQFSPRATGTEEKGRVDLAGGGIIPA